jgi:cytochrome c
MLAAKIISGGKGNWGNISMTPHPELSMDDAKAMVQYILLLKKS